MAENEQTKSTDKRISDRERFRYIGFEVFPGKPKDLFRNDADREKFVNEVQAKRSKGQIIREDCTLLEERVSGLERIVLTMASLLIVGALFLPWFSVYNETREEAPVAEQVAAAPTEQPTEEPALTAGEEIPVDETTPAEVESVPEAADNLADNAQVAEGQVTGEGIRGSEEVIYAGTSQAQVTREYARVSGLSAVLGLGRFGGAVFGSGIGVLLTGVLMLVYVLACLAIPAYTLYNVYGLKGSADDVALKLKKALKVAWWPVLLLVALVFISFLGGNYASEAAGSFSSLGDSYSPVVFLGTISWGVFVSMVGFILIAIKGVEI